MYYTKKSLRELINSRDFHSFRFIWIKMVWWDNLDSRDESIEYVLNYINNTKGRLKIYLSYITKEEHRGIQIALWEIEGIKSPVNYWKEVISDCECKECKQKYWPNGCGFNNEASIKMQKDPKISFFWKHDKVKIKEFVFSEWFEGFEVLSVPDNYIFQVWVKNWGVLLDFGLQFTEYGWLRFPPENKNKIIKQLVSWGFINNNM